MNNNAVMVTEQFLPDNFLTPLPDLSKIISKIIYAIFNTSTFDLKLNILGEKKYYKFKYDSSLGLKILDIEKEDFNIRELSGIFKD